MTNRLFVTLDIPDVTIDEIIRLRDELYGDNHARWESREKLHITLKFLGDSEEELIPKITSMLKEISSGYSSINLSFNHFGMFYRERVPKIFWIGSDQSKELLELQSLINDNCEKLGYEKEKRSFNSHLTLLRIKGNENLSKLEEMKEFKFPSINFLAKTISLIKSELKPTGSVYTIIKSFELSKMEE